jgi:ribonuclease Z
MQDDEIKVEIVCNQNSEGKSMLSFICIPSQKRGKFIPKMAAQLGCNPKKHFKKLVDGESITLDDGTEVTPDQVMEKPLPSECFIINFVPDESFVDSVVSNPKYEAYFESNIDKNLKINMVYHSTNSSSVLENKEYIAFMKKFSSDVNHVID